MSGKDLFEGMSYVDERFVEEAENQSFPKRTVSPWIKAASMAACLCLIVFSLFNLNQHLHKDALEGTIGENTPNQAVPGDGYASGAEYGMLQDTLESMVAPEGKPTSKAPEMILQILELTDTGFVGLVTQSGTFDINTELTVILDTETDSDFSPDDYEVGSLIHVICKSWDKNENTIVVSILGVVEEPICD